MAIDSFSDLSVDEPRVPSRAAVLLAAFGAAALVALLEATQAWLGHRHGYVPGAAFTAVRGSTMSWFDLFERQLASWWIFTCLALLVGLFTQLLPVRPERWLRTLAPHVVGSLVFAVLLTWATTMYRYYIFLRGDSTATFLQILANRASLYFAINWLYYWAIVAVTSAFMYYAMYRQRALNVARLDLELSEAQLRSLQAQMQPHFLFNTMNAICGYALERRHDEVISMLTRLSDLLRSLFRHPPHRAIPLSEELVMLNTYIELQRMRLGERLVVNVRVDDAALGAAVPPLLLQPIVENAIQHGIRGAMLGVVDIEVTRNGTMVEVEVRDNGSGFRDVGGVPPAAPREFGPGSGRASGHNGQQNGNGGVPAGSSDGHGVGMANTAERLHLMYGPRGRLVRLSGRQSGATVRVLFPFVPVDGRQPRSRRNERPDYHTARR
jgi:two-component system, LytTR family, sensor kinase